MITDENNASPFPFALELGLNVFRRHVYTGKTTSHEVLITKDRFLYEIQKYNILAQCDLNDTIFKGISMNYNQIILIIL